MKTDIHADDFALTPNTSKDILECMKKGRLNSISIIANMSCFEECMDMLYEVIPSLPFLPGLNIHLNLVEGLSLADGTSLISMSWRDLFLYSYRRGCEAAKVRCFIEKEISAQIRKCSEAIDRCRSIASEHNIKYEQKGLRIDSHQHTHHIPIVWNCLMKVIKDQSLSVEYIRNSREPLSVFLMEPKLIVSYRIANIIKNLILSVYSKKIDSFCTMHDIPKMYLWGLVMSGRMDSMRIIRLNDHMKERCEKDGRDLEILFHPGLALKDEVSREIDAKAADIFYCSRNRHIEKRSVMEKAAL